MFDGKKILVTGGTGMIGSQLCEILTKRGAIVTAASLDSKPTLPENVNFTLADLTDINQCKKICLNKDIVFHLAGVTGSPKMTFESPSTFMVANLLINTNMLEAATQSGIKKYLFTSTYGVYSPTELMVEDHMWKKPPSEEDKYAGWAKRMGELQVEANRLQYKWQDLYIVRPANVYGPKANFDPKNSMVVASVIKRMIEGENPLLVWGDGSAVRDFIYCKDVARGMVFVMENDIQEPLNIGSGKGVTIKSLVETIINQFSNEIDIKWDISKPTGDKKRILDTSKAKRMGFKLETSLEKGLAETISWYMDNKDDLIGRYNAFKSID